MKKQIEFPKFKNESQEADWWASREGREFVKERSAAARKAGTKFAGSPLVAALRKKQHPDLDSPQHHLASGPAEDAGARAALSANRSAREDQSA
jgi:hypothetical protein